MDRRDFRNEASTSGVAPSGAASSPTASRSTTANGDSPPLRRPASPGNSSPRRASTSLQAVATMNAGLQHESSTLPSPTGSIARNRSSPHAGRRRSSVLMNLQLNDPTVPAPGEMQQDSHLGGLPADPQHHRRTPSLGELHQELEAEQEAHVNRLLQMIRQQQLELQRLRENQPPGTATEDSSAISERSTQGTPIPSSQASVTAASGQAHAGSLSRSPAFPHPRSSFDMAQRRSRTSSRGASPVLRSTSISAESGGDLVLGGRDESAFYQAETQMLTRENQMLRHRIRDLEKQLAEAGPSSQTSTEPAIPSNLTRFSSVDDTNDTTSTTSRH